MNTFQTQRNTVCNTEELRSIVMNINVHVDERPESSFQAPLLGLELPLLLSDLKWLHSVCHQKLGQLIHHLTASAPPPSGLITGRAVSVTVCCPVQDTRTLPSKASGVVKGNWEVNQLKKPSWKLNW